MGRLIALGVVVLLAVLPLGIRVYYDAEGVLLRLILGPVKVTVLPRPKKEPKKKKEKEPAKKTEEGSSPKETLPLPPKPPEKPKEKKKEAKGGSLLDFLPLVQEALRFLNVFRKKLRLNNLELKLIMAGDDPCDLAVNYGRAWAALGNLLPRLERMFVIKKRDLEIACDFTASETLVVARLDITITLGRLLGAVLVFALRALIQFLKIMKKRKGGAAT